MKHFITIRSLACVTLASLSCIITTSCSNEPDFLIFDGEILRNVRTQLSQRPEHPAYVALLHNADSLLDKIPESVTDKETVPPSGDKRDYMSQGPYWWPDPSKPDGLPYIRRDGETNPEIKLLTDASMKNRMQAAVSTLSLAYYMSGEEKYASKAAELLRVWFLDPQKRMNPNLNYSQRVPGVCEGRGIGLIDLSGFPELLEHVSMLRGSKSWTRSDMKALRAWFSEYVKWMEESPNGMNEFTQPNNHGTSYDLQVGYYHLFCGNAAASLAYLEKSARNRFDQIASDGSQPRELARTKSWSYSCSNLHLLLMLAEVAQKAGLDLWHYRNVNGATLRDAVEYFFPVVNGERPWPGQEISGRFSPLRLANQFMYASHHLDGSEMYEAEVDSLMVFSDIPTAPERFETDPAQLIYPFGGKLKYK